MDYRKYYEQKTGIQVPLGYEIHHLDCNRNNNEITNLVALPFELHRRFHRVNLNFKKALSELCDNRYFFKNPTDRLLENIRIYTLTRTEVYEYEALKENQIYENGRR